jgi:hypothetical protein
MTMQLHLVMFMKNLALTGGALFIAAFGGRPPQPRRPAGRKPRAMHPELGGILDVWGRWRNRWRSTAGIATGSSERLPDGSMQFHATSRPGSWPPDTFYDPSQLPQHRP